MYQLKKAIIEEYWLRKLSGELPKISLPLVDNGKNIEDENLETQCTVSFKLEMPAHLVDKLRKVAKDSNIGLFMLFFSGLTIVLHKYTALEDLILGTITPSAEENHNRLLFCRNHISPHLTVKEVITRVKEELVEAIDYAQFSLDGILQELQAKNSGDSFNILNAACIYEPFQKRCDFLEGFDLVFILSEFDNQLHLEVESTLSPGLHSQEIAGKFIRNLVTALERMLENPDQKVAALDILSSEEQEQLLCDFNDTETEYPKDNTIHELFEEQVLRTPHHTAIVFEDKHLTYWQLNKKVNQLARVLRKKGAASEAIFGLLIERSPEMVIGLLAVLKSGGAYLPIDPAYPDERITYMLEESGTNFLLTGKDYAGKFKDPTVESQAVDMFDSSMYTGEDDSNPGNTVSSTNPAYVIYTSGSTGNPKGVMIEHRNVINFVKGMMQTVAFSPGKSILALTTISFDIFVLEVLLPLLNGLTIIVANENQQTNPELLEELIDKNQVNMVQLTPSRLNLLVDGNNNFHCLTGIKELMVGGEPFPTALFTGLKNGFPGKIYNLYGPTETTVWSAVKDLSWEEEITIGNPIANTRVYIVDSYDKLQPVGTVGELCIGGVGVSRGYLNNPELTAEKYTRNRFADGCRVYRTGDLARWLPDGDIECLGRIDHQVKIRGFRIELEEIEAQILNFGNIKEAVVVAKADEAGYEYLSAYFIPVKEVEISELREFLSRRIPDYMVPSFFVPLEEIPLTPNGKVDRKALPDPKLSVDESYAAPRNRIEEKLVEIWSKVLAIEKSIIGIDSNFFVLGGHSLRATIMLSRIHQEFDVKLTLGDVFKAPVIRELVKYIKDAVEEEYISIEHVEKRVYYALSSAQKRLYILQQLEPQSTGYNMPQIILLQEEPDRETLETTFRSLINRHESLRTSFEIIKGEPVHKVHNYGDIEFEVEYKYYDQPAESIIDGFIRPFDLSRPPLLRVELTRSEERRHILMVDMHHIVSDGISGQILAKDFSDLYAGEELSQLSFQYKDYSEWQNRRKKQEVFKQQEVYWLKEFEGEIPVLDLPTDYARPEMQSFEGNTVVFEIDREQTAALNGMARQEGVTLYMVLLAAANALLSRVSSQEDIVVGTPVAGRGHTDLEGIIGIFVNTLVMRNYPTVEKPFTAFLEEVKERCLGAFDNQDYPFEDLVDKIASNRDTGRNPLFDVMFALQNMDTDTDTNTGRKDVAVSVEKEVASESSHYRYESRVSKFDMTITAVEVGETLHFAFQYCTKLFRETTIRRLFAYFKKILSTITTVTSELSIRLGEIEILSEVERQQILYDFNDTGIDYSRDKTLHRLLEEQVKRTPDGIAVIGHSAAGRHTISYKELNKRADQLSHLLQLKGVKPESIVGIMVERSIEMMVGILGIVKAGGAYLPIDPDYPLERVHYMLADSSAKILLIMESEANKVSEKIEVIKMSVGNRFACPKGNFHLSPALATSLAYVTYTSGSTGKPKGVMIEHRSVINFIKGITDIIPFAEGDRILSLTTITFDIFGLETLLPLTAGSLVVIGDKEEQLSAASAARVIEREGITIFQLTPSRLQLIAADPVASTIFKPLGYLLVGGEAFPEPLLARARALFHGKIYNLYGPTETTIWSAVKDVSGQKVLNIGKPIANTCIRILDKTGGLQPIGVPGELCIGGDGLSRGYLNQPELTNEKFRITNYKHLAYIYKTGDLARWLPDGNIECLGRIDYQVKIRGFRIELEEIENLLQTHEHIKEAVVMDRERGSQPGDKYLCAYVVPLSTHQPHSFDTSGLREFLAKRLPDYMMPSYFVSLEKMPLTPNDKIDRKALLKREGQRLKPSGNYVAPFTAIEKTIAQLWKDVLNLEKVGIHDNFFELGGNSINIIQLNNKLKEIFNRDIPVVSMFRYLTIGSFTKYLAEAEGDKGYSGQIAKQQETLKRSRKIYEDSITLFRQGA